MPPLSAPARRRAVAALALAALPTATGCYAYTTVAPGTGQGGQEVLVEVSDQGSSDLAPTLGPRVQMIDGRLGGYTDTTLTLYATRVTRFGGQEQSLGGDTLVLQRRSVGRVSAREFSLGRTLLVIGGTLAAALALATLFTGGEDVGTTPGGDTPGQK